MGLKIKVLLAIAIALTLVAGGSAFILLRGRKPLEFVNKPKQTAYSYKQWINCGDVRQILEEGDMQYVACYGGVLLLNKFSTSAAKQITMTQGLGNLIATSLVKNGDTLFIGTQDGVTKYNLKTNEANKISVKEGLSNGANIKLVKDGNDLWIGTFDGLNRYNLSTGEIQVYKNELAGNSTQYAIRDLIATPNGVYAIVTASAYSKGAIARYDKKTASWESFSPENIYKKVEPYQRIDPMNLFYLNGRVYMTEGDKGIWQLQDAKGSTWVNTISINNKVQKIGASFNTRLVGNKGDLLILWAENTYYFYNTKTGQMENHPELKEYATQAGKGSVTPFEIKLSDRPAVISKILGVINSDLYVLADKGLWKYNLVNSSFSKITALSSSEFQMGDQFYFKPIPSTNKIFVMTQTCGMGCSEPSLNLISYPKMETTALKIPTSFFKSVQLGYPMFYFVKLENGKVFLSFPEETKGKVIAYSLASGNWSAEGETSEFIQIEGQVAICNPSRIFTFNSGVFPPETPCSNVVKDDSYSYLAVPNTDQLLKISLADSSQTKISYPQTEQEYSPFNEPPKTFVRKLTFADGKIWAATERGLAVYDSKTGKWQLISTKEGLTSNRLLDILIYKNQIITQTEGGFAVLTP